MRVGYDVSFRGAGEDVRTSQREVHENEIAQENVGDGKQERYVASGIHEVIGQVLREWKLPISANDGDVGESFFALRAGGYLGAHTPAFKRDGHEDRQDSSEDIVEARAAVVAIFMNIRAHLWIAVRVNGSRLVDWMMHDDRAARTARETTSPLAQ
jgi:hypothetical protein